MVNQYFIGIIDASLKFHNTDYFSIYIIILLYFMKCIFNIIDFIHTLWISLQFIVNNYFVLQS